MAQHAYKDGHQICWQGAKVLQTELNNICKKYKKSAHTAFVANVITQSSLHISPIQIVIIVRKVASYKVIRYRVLLLYNSCDPFNSTLTSGDLHLNLFHTLQIRCFYEISVLVITKRTDGDTCPPQGLIILIFYHIRIIYWVADFSWSLDSWCLLHFFFLILVFCLAPPTPVGFFHEL